MIRELRATRVAAVLAVALAWAASLSTPASAAMADWKGHLAIGYGKLVNGDAPGGGFSVGAGIDVPVGENLRVGPVIGYHLLGTRTVDRGSLTAGIDYSVFEATLDAHFPLEHVGPLRRVSVGAGVMSASANVSSISAGLAFEDLEVSGVHPGASLDLSLLPAGPRPVAVGLELGTRVIFLSSDTWTLATARMVLHF
jgi:hypothetical protein